MNNKVSFRFAMPGDEALIVDFIKKLAEYEHLLDEDVADEALIFEWVFEKRKVEVIFAMKEGREVGYSLFYYNFSTFPGKPGLYLEDLFVLPACRGKGYGKALFKELARIAAARGCSCLEWTCLNWNQPSIDFYLSLGAVPDTQRALFSLTGDPLNALTQL